MRDERHRLARVDAGRQIAAQLRAERVGREATVAVGVRGPRRDHERGIGHDEVKRLVGHRLEQAADPRIDVDPAERKGDPGAVDGPLAQISGHDRCGVTGEVERLHTAPGADVERTLNRPARRQRCQRHGCPANPEHVIGMQRPTRGERQSRVVGHDVPMVGAAIVLLAVGAHFEDCGDVA